MEQRIFAFWNASSGDVFTLVHSSAGDVFVLAHASADAVLLAEADHIGTNSELSFNGNDVMGLFKEDVLLDIIGIFDGGSSYFAKDITLIRNAEILAPNAVYTVAEWTTSPSNSFAGIGSHNQPMARLVKETIITTFNFSIFPNPVINTATIRFELAQENAVRLSITDIAGRHVATLYEGRLSAGFHVFPLNSSEFTSGIYVVTLDTNSKKMTYKLVARQIDYCMFNIKYFELIVILITFRLLNICLICSNRNSIKHSLVSFQ